MFKMKIENYKAELNKAIIKAKYRHVFPCLLPFSFMQYFDSGVQAFKNRCLKIFFAKCRFFCNFHRLWGPMKPFANWTRSCAVSILRQLLVRRKSSKCGQRSEPKTAPTAPESREPAKCRFCRAKCRPKAPSFRPKKNDKSEKQFPNGN